MKTILFIFLISFSACSSTGNSSEPNENDSLKTLVSNQDSEVSAKDDEGRMNSEKPFNESISAVGIKRALIIANSDYQSQTKWADLASANDVLLIKEILKDQGFDEANIIVAEDQTKAMLVNTMNAFTESLNKNDIAVIHYSGHGQRIQDTNGDEVDRLDEAFVPVDAPQKSSENYRGELHYSDDEFSEHIAAMRTKLGSNGHLLVTLDACHSGTATRGETLRGGAAPITWSEIDNKLIDKDKTLGYSQTVTTRGEGNLAKFVTISGVSFDQPLAEIRVGDLKYGSLSYVLSKAFGQLGDDFTYQQLFATVQSIMGEIKPNQTPMIEGDADYKLFRGEIRKQSPYFNILDVKSDTTLTIDGGFVHGLTKESIVSLFPAGTSDPFDDESKKVQEAKIVSVGPTTSLIELDNVFKIEGNKRKNYHVFLTEKNLSQSIQTVKIVSEDQKFKNFITQTLKNKNVIDVIEEGPADIIVEKRMFTINNVEQEIMAFYDFDSTYSVIENFHPAKMEAFADRVNMLAEGLFLKSTEFFDPNYKFSIEYLPVVDDGAGNIEFLNTMDYYNDEYQLEFPVGTMFRLKITNEGNRPFYFAVIDIQPDGLVNAIMPVTSSRITIKKEELYLKKEESSIIPYTIQLGEPYGFETFKIFASQYPINTMAFGVSRGAGEVSHRGSGPMYSLDQFLKGSYGTNTRGAAVVVPSNGSGSSMNSQFYIVPKKD